MSAQEMEVLPVRPLTRPRRSLFDLRRDGPRVAAVLGVLLALDVVLWFALVRPVRAELADLRERKTTADQVELRERQRLQQLRQIHAHVQGVEAGIKTFFDDMLSTKKQRLVPFQGDLMQVGDEFNVAPRTVSVGLEELEKEGLEALAFSFPLTGGYENLREFLARLETMEQFLIVRGVGLTGAKEGGRALQLNVEIQTYFSAPDLRERLARERARAKAESERRARSGGRR